MNQEPAIEVSPEPAPTQAQLHAEAASAGQRLNIAINLEAWRHLPEEVQTKLLWFHQHALDSGLTLDTCASALGYDRTVVYRALKGSYSGNWSNIADAITSYQKLVAERGSVQRQEFCENGVFKVIDGALNYACANNTITLIEGESRTGKTTAARAWKERNNHGRTVYVIAPAYGGTGALLRDMAQAVGVGRNMNGPDTHQAILRAFNSNRILIIDEAHRLLPNDKRSNPVNLEIIRDIHDRTGCAVALIATARFGTQLRRTDYMFEQLLGRIELPVRIHRKLGARDVTPILRQYMADPSEAVLDEALRLANTPGRLGLLVGVLKIASRMIRGARGKVTQDLFFKALKVRTQLMGETPDQFAA